MRHPITIVGGGLAGLSLAIALRRRDVSVSVIEAGTYPRHRVCGEFISGVRPETLRTLGIDGLLCDARRHQTLAWHDQGRFFFSSLLPERALGISRYLLDERLQAAFMALGGDLVTSRRGIPVPREGLVWAAGRPPRTSCGADGIPQAAPEWLGLKGHVRLTLSSDLEMHSGTNGYAGLAGVEQGWTNVCGLFRVDRNIRARGRELLCTYLEAGGNRLLADALRAVTWREGSFSAVAGFGLGNQPAVPGLLCLGDADRMIPPFTGNGMSMAFQAAECALHPLVDWAEGRRSWEDACGITRRLLAARFRRRLAAASLLHRGLLDSGARAALRSLAACGILPFRPLLALVR